MDDKPMNLLPKEAAARLRVSVNTLSNWRVNGCGPRYAKFGSRILYPLAEIEHYERASVQGSTAANRSVS